MFDALRPEVELGYDEGGIAKGRELVAELGFEQALQIVSASSRWLRESGHRVAAVGFCWGGNVAMLANTRQGLTSVTY